MSVVMLRQFLEDLHGFRVDGQPLDVDALRRFYIGRDFAPAWGVDGAGAARVSLLLAALARADEHGLNPKDYHLEAIRTRGIQARDRAAVEREVLLSDALLRYVTHMRTGRLPPARVEPDWAISVGEFDPIPALTRALSEQQRFRAFLTSLPPPAKGYVRLARTLPYFRAIEAAGGWPLVPSGGFLKPGRSDARIPALRRRLAADDEPALRTVGSDYDEAVEMVVRRFQARHGLAVDGIVGPATLTALNVPVSERIRQIGLNLERWRWLPRDLGREYIAVNLADATLEAVSNGQTVLASRVVVGDRRHPTPMFQARVDAVIFNPPWDVPTSIAVDEILPRLRRDPRYLADNDIVIVGRGETDPFGVAVDWSGVPSDPFPFRLRQQPGPRNPLGRIKFDMTNRFDVYLHDTPARSLFGQAMRASSHGCIRVERARELAASLLSSPTTPWDLQMIGGAIAAGNTRRVPFHEPFPVYLLYWTAFVDASDTVQFRDDIYGRDRRLATALERDGGVIAPSGGRGTVACLPAEAEGGR